MVLMIKEIRPHRRQAIAGPIPFPHHAHCPASWKLMRAQDQHADLLWVKDTPAAGIADLQQPTPAPATGG